MLQEKKVSMINYAMNYGAILGLFWALKHLVFIGADHFQPLIYLYYLLNAVTFVLIYVYYFKFRDIDPEKPQGSMECILFIILLCLFASFFESAMIYVHLQFIDPTYFSSKIEPILKGMVASFPYSPEVKAQTLAICSNKIFYIISDFFGNILFGAIMGSLLALIIGNKKKSSI